MQRRRVEVEIIVVTGKEAARCLGLEPRRFQQLVAEGWIEGKLARNEYDLGQCIRNYADYIRQK